MYSGQVVATNLFSFYKDARNPITITANAISPKVIKFFFVEMNPADRKLQLYTSSVKKSKNLPSLPNSRSHRGQRCFLLAVSWISVMMRSIIIRLGTIAKKQIPRASEMNSGFSMI